MDKTIFSPSNGAALRQDSGVTEPYRALINAASDGFVMLNASGKLLDVNDAFCQMLGYTRAELLGANLSLLKPASEAADIEGYFQKLIEQNQSRYETKQRRKDGLLIDVEVSAVLLEIEGGLIAAFCRDITVRKQTERLMRESENRFREVADFAPVLIWMFDRDKRCSYVNQRWLDFTGRAVAAELGDGWTAIVHRDDLADCLQTCGAAFDRREPFELEFRMRRADGEYRWMLATGVPRFSAEGEFSGYIGSCLDITAHKVAEDALHKSEAQIRQSQKMEAIGKLSGGIAHDFNNLLAVIMLHVDMLNLQLPADSSLRHRVTEIKAATERGASLTRQLLAFSRKQMLQPRVVNLNKTVRETGDMLRRLIGEDVELRFDLTENLSKTLVDPDQMTQVLMNLAVNARDAMPDGGVLKIETRNIFVDERTRRRDASQPAGLYVELIVTDTGHGIDAATQERIFEPFFTTKDAGKGTGLGLSTVYGIVKQSGGFVWVTSAPGAGASFQVQLPAVAEEAFETLPPLETHPAIMTGSETILLVEDEKSIRRAAIEVLRMLGYQVLVAANGEEACDVAESYDKPIHLLLTDVVMPKMNGRQLAERITAARPETAVLFMSGYTDDIIARHGGYDNGTMFLEKPFTPSKLAEKVREILEKK